MNTNKIFAHFFNFFRLWKVKENRITLIEKLDTGGTGSLYEIKDECDRRGMSMTYNIIRHSDYEVSLSNLAGLFALFFKKAYYMATSSHIFLNDNFMPMAYMKLSEKTTVVQLWHGMGSFKKFGGSAELDGDVLNELKGVNENVTHILASSTHIVDNYAESFCVPKEKVLTIGCPQADYYFRPFDTEKERCELQKEYPSLKGKKLVLYAPTFRDDVVRDKEILSHFDFEQFQKELGDEYAICVRLHPQIQNSEVPSFVTDLTRYPNVRQLLMMTDILIADYSSIAVEFSLLERPILIYAYDKDWYLSHDRGFYFDFEKTAPGPILEDMDALITAIKEKMWNINKVKSFARLHNDYFDANSASRVVDYYFGEGV